MHVTASKGKLIIKHGKETVLAAGEVVNGRALVRVPAGFGDMLRSGFNGHVAMVDGSGMASAPPANHAKKLLREMGVDAELINEAFGHLR